MNRYTVQKEVRQAARIIGLRIDAFYLFMIVFLLSAFYLINGFKVSQFLMVVLIDIVAYIAMLAYQNIDFNQVVKILPKVITNK